MAMWKIEWDVVVVGEDGCICESAAGAEVGCEAGVGY